MGERVQEDKAQDHQKGPQGKGQEESGGSQFPGGLDIFGAQVPGDGVAGAVAAEKSQGLDDGHHREYHTHRGGGAGSNLADEESVGHVVE